MKTPEGIKIAEKKNPTMEAFLGASTDLIQKLLKKDPGYFDSLGEERSSSVLRKLTEIIKNLDEAEKTTESEKLKALQRQIYENLESPLEPKFFQGFTKEQKTTVMSAVGSVELTKGCSVACRFCGFNAEPGVKGQIPFGDLVYLASHYASVLPEDKKEALMLYWASDPLDWKDGDKNYVDVVELFSFYGRRPFTSTAYPKSKPDVFKEMMERGYINRVSVSEQNIKRLEYEGWLTRDDSGKITSPHEAIRVGLDQGYENRGVIYRMKPDEERISAGRAFKEGKKTEIGGIECQTGVLLRTDGFYNDIPCTPSKEHPTGVILQKVLSENISKPIEKDNLPKTIDELIKYGLVSHGQSEFGHYRHVILNNFNGEINKNYYAEYNPDTLEIADVEEIKVEDEKALGVYVDIRQHISESQDESGTAGIFQKVRWAMTPGADIKSIKKSLFYQKLLEATGELITDFVTSPDFGINSNIVLVSHNLSLSSGDEDAEFERQDLMNLVLSFKNIFILARDGVLKLDSQMADEVEKEFMDKLYDSIKKVIEHPPRYARKLDNAQKIGTIEFLNTIFAG